MTTIELSYSISKDGILEYSEIMEIFEKKGYTTAAVEIKETGVTNMRFWKSSEGQTQSTNKTIPPVSESVEWSDVKNYKTAAKKKKI